MSSSTGSTCIMRRVLGATIDSYGISAESSWVSCDDRRKRRAAGFFVVATQVVLVPVTWMLAVDAFVALNTPTEKKDETDCRTSVRSFIRCTNSDSAAEQSHVRTGYRRPQYRPGSFSLVIAEGQYDKAIQLVDAAAAAGAELVKFRCHITEKEMVPTNLAPGRISKEELWHIIKCCELTVDEDKRVQARCANTRNELVN